MFRVLDTFQTGFIGIEDFYYVVKNMDQNIGKFLQIIS